MVGEKKEPDTSRIERNDNVDTSEVSAPSGKVKQAAVENVALADALVKDHLSWTSASSLRLFSIMLLITLSVYFCPLRMT